MDRDAKLGVFDSGLGGLTVVRALREVLPEEDIVYLGDTARVPYGTKGPGTVVRYALACSHYLATQNVKAIVIACNTVSAVAPAHLRAALDLPVIGVIEPGARAAVDATHLGRIGVLATAGTIASGAYPQAIAALSTRVEAFGQAAPLLVPLAEEGWLEGDVPTLAVRRYLAPLAKLNVDVVVLGCTHYPLLRGIIEREVASMLGPEARVVDSAHATALETRSFLETRNLLKTPGMGRGSLELRVTDLPKNFAEVASRFLGEPCDHVAQIDL